jgi:hypothetical protein
VTDPSRPLLVWERLDESHVPYRVEIVDLNDAAPSLRRRVLEEGMRWRD